MVGDQAGDVVALDIRDGMRRWAFHTLGEVRSSPGIVEGIVYVGSADGNLYALDLATGARRWAFVTGGAVSRTSAIDGGVVYVGSEGGIVNAVDAASGIRRWQKILGPGQVSSLAVEGGLVVAAGGLDDSANAHILFGIDAATGTDRWQFSAPTGAQLIIGALGDASVFAPSDDGNVYAVDRLRRRRRSLRLRGRRAHGWAAVAAGRDRTARRTRRGRWAALPRDGSRKRCRHRRRALTDCANRRRAARISRSCTDLRSAQPTAQGA